MTYRGALRFGSRLSGSALVLLAGVTATVASCGLNPQPEPPGATGDSAGVTAGGTSSTGGQHASTPATGAGGTPTVGSTGANGGSTSAGGSSGLTTPGGAAGSVAGAGGTGGAGGTQTPGPGAGGTSMSEQGGGGDKADGGGAGESGVGGGISGGEGGSSEAGSGPGTGGAASGGEAGTGGAANDPIEQACAAFGDAYCALLEQCEPFLIQTTWGSESACAAATNAGCVAELGGPNMPPPSWKSSCASTLATADCTVVDGDGTLSICLPPPGPVAVGDACEADVQCASGFCNVYGVTKCGACAAAPGVGDPCAENVWCPIGLFCSESTMRCQTPAAIGSPCSKNDASFATNVCVPPSACVNGMCAAPLGMGASCSDPFACDTAHGLICTGSSQADAVCTPAVTAMTGMPCGNLSDDSFAFCVGGSECLKNDDGSGMCSAEVAVGESCANDEFCVPPAVCEGASRVCAEPTFACSN